MAYPSVAIKKRPKHLELWKIRLPIPGVVSILHRITGFGMFLALIPILLVILDRSLASQESFEDLRFQLSGPLPKLIVLAFSWAFLHHFFAGIRYLLLDLHWGIDLPSTRFWSKAVLVAGAVSTLLVAVALW
jgi:succinate dehydrogenase / fumarate reductase cytochrome b subunit